MYVLAYQFRPLIHSISDPCYPTISLSFQTLVIIMLAYQFRHLLQKYIVCNTREKKFTFYDFIVQKVIFHKRHCTMY